MQGLFYYFASRYLLFAHLGRKPPTQIRIASRRERSDLRWLSRVRHIVSQMARLAPYVSTAPNSRSTFIR